MWPLGRLSVRRKFQILGLCLLCIGAFLILALVTRDARDQTVELLGNGAVRNQGGVLGALLSGALVSFLGLVGSWAAPLVFVAWGWNRLRAKPALETGLRTALGFVGLFFLLGFLHLITSGNRALSGGAGESVATVAARLLGKIGGELILGTALVVVGVVAFEVGSSQLARQALQRVLAMVAAPFTKEKPGTRLKPAAETSAADPAAAPARGRKPAAIEEEEIASAWQPVEAEKPKAPSRPRIVARRDEPRGEPLSIPFPPPAPKAAAPKTAAPVEAGLKLGPAAGPEMELPSIDLLDRHESKRQAIDEKELLELSRVLERTLADFDVEGKVSEVHPGPVITLFEFEPAPGMKVSQILNRQDDLALALKAQRIRIVAPIPGKAAVGIEIPNRVKATVSLREIISSAAFQDSKDALPLALGKDVAGVPFATSLERMPHLLIAGATGSGKSVCINTLIMSLLYTRTPAELRFIFIDPKMLELTPFNGIPHLRMPVVTDPKKAAQALRFCVKEMERRYQMLAKHGARNIEGYNRMNLDPSVTEEPKLPYLVIVVDELADLMALLPTEIEEPVGRLAQMARAVGIHLVLATQRPSVDVITGMIKANFPSRIAFQVASRTDSRVILDMNGAESLLGHGDSLYLPAGKPEPYRIHGAFVSGEEIERVVAFLKSQGKPVVADDSALEQVRIADQAEDSDDELIAEAMRIVVLHQQASTSMLQRRLKVGYSRAARLLDILEERGVVGPSEGAKGREVRVTEQELADRAHESNA
ncbi:MAG TPA: DNA translocase FtsK 4TM domain-containing protein [Candidatus Saccharimonadales bacterium]|nr:DNA translocase FtsK 4TM domain-containing protein [Candidatus Saccharimonadales bacterium]